MAGLIRRMGRTVCATCGHDRQIPAFLNQSIGLDVRVWELERARCSGMCSSLPVASPLEAPQDGGLHAP